MCVRLIFSFNPEALEQVGYLPYRRSFARQ